VYGENIADTQRLAATGNADVAIVALSLALAADEAGDGTWVLLDEDLHEPLQQDLVVVGRGPGPCRARQPVHRPRQLRGRPPGDAPLRVPAPRRGARAECGGMSDRLVPAAAVAAGRDAGDADHHRGRGRGRLRAGPVPLPRPRTGRGDREPADRAAPRPCSATTCWSRSGGTHRSGGPTRRCSVAAAGVHLAGRRDRRRDREPALLPAHRHRRDHRHRRRLRGGRPRRRAARHPARVHVTLPLAGRGIIAGISLAFARALGDFGTTIMVAGNIPGRTQTMPIAVYDRVQAFDYATAGVLAAVLSAVAIVVLLGVRRLERTAL
jgi:hypothetical protein